MRQWLYQFENDFLRLSSQDLQLEQSDAETCMQGAQMLCFRDQGRHTVYLVKRIQFTDWKSIQGQRLVGPSNDVLMAGLLPVCQIYINYKRYHKKS
jgi:hypothetical protein